MHINEATELTDSSAGAGDDFFCVIDDAVDASAVSGGHTHDPVAWCGWSGVVSCGSVGVVRRGVVWCGWC